MWQVPPPHMHPIRCVGAPFPYVDPNPNPNPNPNQACPFPSAVALLLHRIKADLVAEKRRAHLELAATSGPERRGSSAPALAPAQAAEISRKLGTKTDFVALLDEFAPRFYGEVSKWVLTLSQLSWY